MTWTPRETPVFRHQWSTSCFWAPQIQMSKIVMQIFIPPFVIFYHIETYFFIFEKKTDSFFSLVYLVFSRNTPLWPKCYFWCLNLGQVNYAYKIWYNLYLCPNIVCFCVFISFTIKFHKKTIRIRIIPVFQYNLFIDFFWCLIFRILWALTLRSLQVSRRFFYCSQLTRLCCHNSSSNLCRFLVEIFFS